MNILYRLVKWLFGKGKTVDGDLTPPEYRQYNMIEDTPDPRDYEYMATYVGQPNSYEIKDKFPVRSQGTLGACGGFAATTAMEIVSPRKLQETGDRLSPLHAYYIGRYYTWNGDTSHDWGVQTRDLMKGMNKEGCSLEETWPYIPSKFADKPSFAATFMASAFKIRNYERVSLFMDDLEDLRDAIVNNKPVVCGFDVYSNMHKGDATGVIPMPGSNDELVGGHAVCIVGYNDTKRQFKFKNSWGAGWGDYGYGYLSYDYVKKYVNDLWAVEL